MRFVQLLVHQIKTSRSILGHGHRFLPSVGVVVSRMTDSRRPFGKAQRPLSTTYLDVHRPRGWPRR